MILFFGDTHGSHRHMLKIIEKQKPAAVILLGDIEANLPLEKELEDIVGLTDVWWIHGNHDVDKESYYHNLFNSKLADRNLHGRVVEIDGLKVAGLGGIFREKIWYPFESVNAKPVYVDYDSFVEDQLRAEKFKQMRDLKNAKSEHVQSAALIGKALLHKSSIFYNDWEELFINSADILVTHEAPTYHKHGFAAIDELAQAMKVKYAFHGHHHENFTYGEHLGFKAFGVGLRKAVDLDGNFF